MMSLEESAAVQALSTHALSCLGMAAYLAPQFVTGTGNGNDEDIDGAGVLMDVAAHSIDDATDIIDRHRIA